VIEVRDSYLMHSVYWQLLVIIPTRTPVGIEKVLDMTLHY